MLCLPFAGFFFLDILAPITVSPGKSGAKNALLKTPRAHFEGSIIPGSALWRLQNSAGQKLAANLPRGVFEPLKYAPRYGPFKVRPWSFGAMQCVPALSRGQNTHKNHLKLRFSYFLKGIFVNHFHTEHYFVYCIVHITVHYFTRCTFLNTLHKHQSD